MNSDAKPYTDRIRNLQNIKPNETTWLVTHNDNSDHGRAEVFFPTESQAVAYAEQQLIDGRQGNAFHPPPRSLNCRVFEVSRHPFDGEWEADRD